MYVIQNQSQLPIQKNKNREMIEKYTSDILPVKEKQ